MKNIRENENAIFVSTPTVPLTNIQTISRGLMPNYSPTQITNCMNHRSRYKFLPGADDADTDSVFPPLCIMTNKTASKNFVFFGSPVPGPGSKRKPIAKFFVTDWGIQSTLAQSRTGPLQQQPCARVDYIPQPGTKNLSSESESVPKPGTTGLGLEFSFRAGFTPRYRNRNQNKVEPKPKQGLTENIKNSSRIGYVFLSTKTRKVFFLRTSQILHLLQRKPQIFPYATMRKHTFYNVGYTLYKEQKQSRFKKTNKPFIYLTKKKRYNRA